MLVSDLLVSDLSVAEVLLPDLIAHDLIVSGPLKSDLMASDVRVTNPRLHSCANTAGQPPKQRQAIYLVVEKLQQPNGGQHLGRPDQHVLRHQPKGAHGRDRQPVVPPHPRTVDTPCLPRRKPVVLGPGQLLGSLLTPSRLGADNGISKGRRQRGCAGTRQCAGGGLGDGGGGVGGGGLGGSGCGGVGGGSGGRVSASHREAARFKLRNPQAQGAKHPPVRGYQPSTMCRLPTRHARDASARGIPPCARLSASFQQVGNLAALLL